MKRLILLVLICSMIGLPVSAVDPNTRFKIIVSSGDTNESLIRGYLKRELQKLVGVNVVKKNADWVIHACAIKHYDGMYAISIAVIRNINLKPYMRGSLTNDFKELFTELPEYQASIIHTSYDLRKMCEEMVVIVDSYR